jgi:hypothetical protein
MTEMRREATAAVPPQKSCRIAVLKKPLEAFAAKEDRSANLHHIDFAVGDS